MRLGQNTHKLPQCPLKSGSYNDVDNIIPKKLLPIFWRLGKALFDPSHLWDNFCAQAQTLLFFRYMYMEFQHSFSVIIKRKFGGGINI